MVEGIAVNSPYDGMDVDEVGSNEREANLLPLHAHFEAGPNVDDFLANEIVDRLQCSSKREDAFLDVFSLNE